MESVHLARTVCFSMLSVLIVACGSSTQTPSSAPPATSESVGPSISDSGPGAGSSPGEIVESFTGSALCDTLDLDGIQGIMPEVGAWHVIPQGTPDFPVLNSSITGEPFACASAPVSEKWSSSGSDNYITLDHANSVIDAGNTSNLTPIDVGEKGFTLNGGPGVVFFRIGGVWYVVDVRLARAGSSDWNQGFSDLVAPMVARQIADRMRRN